VLVIWTEYVGGKTCENAQTKEYTENVKFITISAQPVITTRIRLQLHRSSQENNKTTIYSKPTPGNERLVGQVTSIVKEEGGEADTLSYCRQHFDPSQSAIVTRIKN